MVTFRMIFKSDKEIRYEYFPEGNKASTPGIIDINLVNKEIKVLLPAEQDILITATAESLNVMRKSINEMRAELGEQPLTEEELPIVTHNRHYYCYASKAINRIIDSYNNGILLEDGHVIWY